MKVGNLVIPSSEWLGHSYYDEKILGVGIITEIMVGGSGKIQCRIIWSSADAYDTWEYDFELEVINES